MSLTKVFVVRAVVGFRVLLDCLNRCIASCLGFPGFKKSWKFFSNLEKGTR